MSEKLRKSSLATIARQEMLDEHPVISKEYTILTPMIEAAYKLLRDRVWMRKTGTVMYAPPQVGKSKCRSAVELFLKEEFPKAFIISFTADDGRRPGNTSSGMLRDILNAEGILNSSKQHIFKNMFFDLVTHIQVSIGAGVGKQFILIVDEMQLLSSADLQMLLVLHNRLKDLKISMTTIGFAQPEILHMRTALKAAKAQQLIARFLVEPIQFDGCASKQDLEVILKAYDLDKCYPEGSDWTYTRFFLPVAYDAGFRLSDFSDQVWQSLLRVCDPSFAATVPMVHLTGTVEYLLASNIDKDSSNFTLSDVQIDHAISASGLSGFYDVVDVAL